MESDFTFQVHCGISQIRQNLWMLFWTFIFNRLGACLFNKLSNILLYCTRDCDKYPFVSVIRSDSRMYAVKTACQS